jgi:lipopolysaccharide export system permease protein
MTLLLMPMGNKMAIDNLKRISKTVSINDMKENQLYDDIPGVLIFVRKILGENTFGQMTVIDKNQGLIISSREGKILTTDKSEIAFVFKDGTLMRKSDESYSKIAFNSFKVRIPVPVDEKFQIQGERFMYPGQLVKNFDKKLYKFEFSKRFAIAFAAFIMAVLGMAFGSFFHRAGKSLGVFFSLVVVFFYNIILIFSENMINYINPFLAAWLSNILFAGVAVFVLKKVFR